MMQTRNVVSVGTPRTGAFTLIEVLVVITIIAVLAGLLFPAFKQAIRQSKASTNIQNFRQIYAGCQGFANDNDDTYPTGDGGRDQWGGAGRGMIWLTYILPYMGDPDTQASHRSLRKE